MPDVVEHFIKGADNVITLTLTEDGSAIAGAWTRLEIWIGVNSSPPQWLVEIERMADGDGVTLNPSNGELTITPADLTEDLSALEAGARYRAIVIVYDAINDDGAVFGGDDSPGKLLFRVSEKPT